MSKKLLKLFFIGVLYFAGAAAVTGYEGWDPAGHWQGSFTYREAELPFRLAVTNGEAGYQASLDIPDLVYAEQALAIKQLDGETFQVSFPLGIGDYEWNAGGFIENGNGVTIDLQPGSPPPYRKNDITFSDAGRELPGTVYMPEGEGPHPAVVLIAGSGKANRSQWAYASWADYYARLGYAALVYDRPQDFSTGADGTLLEFHGHARIVAAAINKLKTLPGIDVARIGVAGTSRGNWIAMALGDYVPDLAFMVMISPGITTPGEQEVDSILTGMADDGLAADQLTAARTYLRLYFYVAETGQGWDLLAAAMANAENTNWFQYVDQPRTLEDLKWWQAHMNFPTRQRLQQLTTPVLAMWGGADFITPWAAYQGKFEHDLELAGNKNFTSVVFEGADHRLELDPGVDKDGNWHWFGMAPGVLQQIRDWLGALGQ